VACFEPTGDPYDIVLDDYEPGMKTHEVVTIFDALKAALLPWLHGVGDSEPADDSCLRGHFPRTAQRRFSLGMLERWGMDRAAWRLDRTVHPFATSFAPTDIRLTIELPRGLAPRILSLPATNFGTASTSVRSIRVHALARFAGRVVGVPRVAEPDVENLVGCRITDLAVLRSEAFRRHSSSSDGRQTPTAR
jgi:hypothetical protein